MNEYPFELRKISLKGKSRQQLVTFLESFHLNFDDDVQEAIGIFISAQNSKTESSQQFGENDLIACGGCSGHVIKCIAIREEFQNTGLLSKIISYFYSRMKKSGIQNILIYTKPEQSEKFINLGFNAIVKTENVALLESESDGISRYVEKIRERLPAEINEFGCIVMNANPFTNGHQYLVDTASRQCRHLLIFPVKEDRSVFPYEVRLQLIKENIRPYENISLLDGSDYIISAASFPTYFLKENSDISRIQAELDLTLFGSRIAAPLRITQRFVGTEPYDLMTAGYNAQMKKILPMYGVQPIIIPRLEIEGKAVSASQIRKMLYENDFSSIEKFVPPATYHFLISDEAIPIIQKIKQKKL